MTRLPPVGQGYGWLCYGRGTVGVGLYMTHKVRYKDVGVGHTLLIRQLIRMSGLAYKAGYKDGHRA